jgi:hypothetical protein
MDARSLDRRRLLVAAGAVASVGWPALTSARGLPAMTDGPFYPSIAYRARSLDWDADLTTVRGRAPDGQPLEKARGEHLDLHGIVRDGNGRVVDGAEIEIWQCDAFGSYRHPRGAGDRIDAGFQGFGATRSDGRGGYRFRAGRRTSTSSCAIRRSARSRPSCSSSASRAMPAISSTAVLPRTIGRKSRCACSGRLPAAR